MQKSKLNLVADIGGTNIRLGLFENQSEVTNIKAYQAADFPLINDAIKTYFDEVGVNAENEALTAAFSVACPPDGDEIKLTNHEWVFSINALKQDMHFKDLKVVNDFVALALSLPSLGAGAYELIGPDLKPQIAPKAVIGPGTGLGVGGIAPYVKDGNLMDWVPIPGEGGHVTMCAASDEEENIIKYMRDKVGHVSAERLVSGFGMTQLYDAVCALNNRSLINLDPQKATPEDISTYAIERQDALCLKTLTHFCEMLGTVSGNLALTLGAKGGLYLAGGILPKLLNFFKDSNFRTRFEEKGRMGAFNKAIPTYVITENYPAFIGLKSLF